MCRVPAHIEAEEGSSHAVVAVAEGVPDDEYVPVRKDHAELFDIHELLVASLQSIKYVNVGSCFMTSQGALHSVWPGQEHRKTVRSVLCI